MDVLAQNPLITFLIALNYALVAVSLVHLVFRTNYTVGQRLNWVVVLWILPVLGLAAYWLFRLRKN